MFELFGMNRFPYPDLVTQCHECLETMGCAGDVTLAHPHLLHNFSQSHSGRPRLPTISISRSPRETLP